MTRRPSDWPDGIEPISIERIERLGINARNELFRDGHRLVTSSRLSLTIPQTFLAILAAVASLATIATGLNNASVFLCTRHVDWLGCPVEPVHGVASGAPGVSPRPPH